MDVYLFKTTDPDLFRKKIEEAVANTRRRSIKWNASESQTPKRKKDDYVGWRNSGEGGSSLLIDTNCHDVISALADSLSSPLLRFLKSIVVCRQGQEDQILNLSS